VPEEMNAATPQGRAIRDGDLIAQLTLDYLDVLNGSRGDLPSLDDLSPSIRRQVLRAWSGIDHLITDEPVQPLGADPTAIALGAVPVTQLDPAAMRQARQARNLRPSDIAASLQKRGWRVNTAEVFGWERRPERIAPALLADIAATIDVPETSLARSTSSMAQAELDAAEETFTAFVQVLYSDDLNEVVGQWAQLLDLDPGAARDDLQRRLSGAAYRGARALTTRQWKAVLSVLLANEQVRRGQSNDPDGGR
jgi:hypothetical protein